MRTLSIESAPERQTYTGVADHEAAAVSVEAMMSDDEGVRRTRRGPLLLTAILAMATMCAGLYWHMSGRDVTVASSPSEVSKTQEEPRLLESEELMRLAMQHTLRFHADAGLPLHELTPEQREHLERQLTDHARQSAQAIGEHVMQHDAEAGRALQELKLTPEHWAQTHAILDALHDQRVQEMGRDIAQTADRAGADTEAARKAVAEKLSGRKDELRQLADELIPSAVRDVPSLPNGERHWELLVGSKGEITESGPLGKWHATMELNPPEQNEDEAPARRLQVQMTNVPAWYVTTLKGMFVCVGTVLATTISLISTLLTSVLGPFGTKVIFWVQTSLAIADCGTELGLTLGIAQLRQWYQWIPCMVMSFFTGIEAIWTFLK